ncbi:MAG: sterol desaturase family protein [Actinomycetia bacterium]|nr:sterol desaturase family protein [Actinomycetes bacterium]
MTRTRREVIELLLIGSTIAVALVINHDPLFGLAVAFAVVVPFEKMFPRHKGQPIRRPQVGTDIAYLLASPALNVITMGVAIVIGVISLIWIPGLVLRPVVGLIPAVALPLVGLVLFDLATYWAHRWAHEVPILWRFHAVHHSTEHLDWISGFRTHPFDGALVVLPFVFLMAAGFEAELAGVLAAIQIIVGFFLHANVRWRLRPFHRLVITPEFHHWHHTKDPKAIQSNYSVFLPLWDQLFGTYFMPQDRRPEDYGIDEYMPAGMVAQMRYPFRGCPNPLRAFRHPIRALKLVFRVVKTVAGQVYRSTTKRNSYDPVPVVSSGGGFDEHLVHQPLVEEQGHLDWPPPTASAVRTHWTPPQS